VDERSSITLDQSSVKQWHSGSDVVNSVQSKLVTDSVGKYSSEPGVHRQPTPVDSGFQETSSVDVEQLEKDLSAGHESAVAELKSQLEDFRRSRDELATVIYRIKTEYRDAVSSAEQTVPRHLLDVEKEEIQERYERQMDRVREDLQVLKACHGIVNVQLSEEASVWKNFEEERQKVDEDVKAGRVERRLAPDLVDAAAKRYSEETRRLRRVAEADKTKVQTKVINERFEREKRHVLEDVEDGKLTETEADCRMERLIKARSAELKVVGEQTEKRLASGSDAADQQNTSSEVNFDRKSSVSRSQSRSGALQDVGDDAAAAARRLKTLEEMLVDGGRCVSRADTRVIRERLRCVRNNAEERQRRLQVETGPLSVSVSFSMFTGFAKVNLLVLQCFDTVGWAAGRASGL